MSKSSFAKDLDTEITGSSRTKLLLSPNWSDDPVESPAANSSAANLDKTTPDCAIRSSPIAWAVGDGGVFNGRLFGRHDLFLESGPC